MLKAMVDKGRNLDGLDHLFHLLPGEKAGLPFAIQHLLIPVRFCDAALETLSSVYGFCRFEKRLE